MGASELVTLATNFGGMGLLFGYVVWRDLRRDKLDQARIDADKSLATALALLEAAVKAALR